MIEMVYREEDPSTASESVPYPFVVAELQRALHAAQTEVVMLRARIAMRDRDLAALRSAAAHGPQHDAEQQDVGLQPPAGHEPVQAAAAH